MIVKNKKSLQNGKDMQNLNQLASINGSNYAAHVMLAYSSSWSCS